MDKWVKRYEVGGATGKQVTELMKDITCNDWQYGDRHEFSINGRPTVSIEPNPTAAQPGNGVIKFGNMTPSWNDVQRSMDKNYPQRVEDFYNKPLREGFKPQNKSGKAAWMESFEEARRVPWEGRHLGSDQVRAGIRIANEQGKPRDAIGMFRGPPEERQQAWNEIRGASTSNAQSNSTRRSGNRNHGYWRE